MSEQDRELLARIGQLAGQINRHKNQQAGVAPSSHHASLGAKGRGSASFPQRFSPYANSQYRHASAPYSRPRGGYRGGRGRGAPAVHRNRTLHLNNLKPAADSSSPSSAAAADGPSGWVTRNDRHRQLINANVYEKEAQNRTKAIEETRQRKLQSERHIEKQRFNNFMRHQAPAPGAPNAQPQDKRNELTISGLLFRVMDGGKKLARVKDDSTGCTETPKSATVAGVTFHRTKTGNLVANRVVQDHRRSVGIKKIDVPCRVFSSTGKYYMAGFGRTNCSCTKGPSCRFMHDADKVAVCKDFLKEGKCGNGESCDLSHDITPERVPNCLHYAKGHCAKADCVYTHSEAAPSAPVCEAFGFCGFCEKGANCANRHVFECPDFANTGVCRNKRCKLQHRERASVLRSISKPDEVMEDVSSDEGAVDSDDVDSDDVAELIEADSDDSDFENPKDFLPV